jgi:hypothetical protein
MTATPAPVVGRDSVLYSGSEGRFGDDRSAQICETTTFTAKFWNGDETACGADYTTCFQEVASVAFDDVAVRREMATSEEGATVTIDAAEFGSFQIREVVPHERPSPPPICLLFIAGCPPNEACA